MTETNKSELYNKVVTTLHNTLQRVDSIVDEIPMEMLYEDGAYKIFGWKLCEDLHRIPECDYLNDFKFLYDEGTPFGEIRDKYKWIRDLTEYVKGVEIIVNNKDFSSSETIRYEFSPEERAKFTRECLRRDGEMMDVVKKVEEGLLGENENVRILKVNSNPNLECFYSSKEKCIVPAMFILDEQTKRITFTIAEGHEPYCPSENFSAKRLAEEWWGKGVQGDELFAMSPFGKEMNISDLARVSVSYEIMLRFYNLDAYIKSFVKDIPNEELKNDYAIVALERLLNESFKLKGGFETQFQYIFNKNHNIGPDSTPEDYIQAIEGFEVKIEKPGEFVTSVCYYPNGDAMWDLEMACNDRDLQYERDMREEQNNQKTPTTNDDEPTI